MPGAAKRTLCLAVDADDLTTQTAAGVQRRGAATGGAMKHPRSEARQHPREQLAQKLWPHFVRALEFPDRA